MASRFLSCPVVKSIMVMLCLATGLAPDAGFGFEYRFGWAFFDGLFKETNYLDSQILPLADTLETDDTYAILGAYPNVAVAFNDHFSAFFQAGLEWTHSWDAADGDDWDADVIAAAVGYSSGTVSADIGVQAFRPGRGLITHSDEPGVSVRLDPWDPIYIKGEVFQVMDASPLAVLTLGYRPGFLETVEIFGAGYHDADEDLSAVFAPFMDGADVATSADLYWVGAAAEVFIQKAYLTGLWIGQFGRVTPEGPGLPDGMDVAAFLVDLEMRYPMMDNLSAAVFLFASNGDSRPLDDRLTVFVSPMPFNDRTAIFFNGGFARFDVEKRMTLGGVTWDGVIAPGIGLDYEPLPKIAMRLKSALLFSENGSWDRESRYGWETDTSVRYEFYPDQQLFFEAGVLVHGDYWKARTGFRPDPSTRLAAGLELVF